MWAEKGTDTQSKIHFASLQKNTGKKNLSQKSPNILFAAVSKKKTARIVPFKYLS